MSVARFKILSWIVAKRNCFCGLLRSERGWKIASNILWLRGKHTSLASGLRCGRGAAGTRSGLYRQRLFDRLSLYLAGPDSQRRIPAMGPFAPPRVHPDVPERFLVQQNELMELIRAAGNVDLNQARVPSPLSRFLTLSLGEALEILVAHQQRHLVQARRALQEIRSQCPTDESHAEATEASPPTHRLSGRERLPPDR